jgi:hypothetical protein
MPLPATIAAAALSITTNNYHDNKVWYYVKRAASTFDGTKP